MYAAKATSATADSAWKKLRARTSEAFSRKYARTSEAVASSGGKLLVPSTSPNSSPEANSRTVSTPLAAQSRCSALPCRAPIWERPVAEESLMRSFQHPNDLACIGA
jgi:hypothetical protein